MARFVSVCRSEHLVEGKGLAVEVEGLALAVFRNAGRVHAMLERCPHANGPLSRGWIEEGEVVCPLHRWRFRLTDGRCSTVPGHTNHVFRCEEVDGEVRVEV